MGILNNVTIRPESVAGTMHADLQAKIGFWGETRAEECKELTFSLRPLPFISNKLVHFGRICNKVWCKENLRCPWLTSVHQPLPHCICDIKGDPLRCSLGQDILAPNVALFGFGVVFLEDLWGKMKMWPSCINSLLFLLHTYIHRTRAVCLSQTLQDALGQMSTLHGKSDSLCWYPHFAS